VIVYSRVFCTHTLTVSGQSARLGRRTTPVLAVIVFRFFVVASVVLIGNRGSKHRNSKTRPTDDTWTNYPYHCNGSHQQEKAEKE